MGNRLSRIYTRTGDDGTTGLGDGSRVPKDSARVEAYGTVDELKSAIGLVLSFCTEEPVRACLTRVQNELFNLGGELCMPNLTLIGGEDVERIEADLDRFNASLPPLQDFILPGGSPDTAHCHLARTICRRAERRTVSLAAEAQISADLVNYLNRLSDLLFVLARVLGRAHHDSEQLWEHERGSRP